MLNDESRILNPECRNDGMWAKILHSSFSRLIIRNFRHQAFSIQH